MHNFRILVARILQKLIKNINHLQLYASIALLTLISQNLYSQKLDINFEIERFSISEGLSSDNLRDLELDQNNVAYILSDRSLTRYNGEQFEEILQLTDLNFKPDHLILKVDHLILYRYKRTLEYEIPGGLELEDFTVIKIEDWSRKQKKDYAELNGKPLIIIEKALGSNIYDLNGNAFSFDKELNLIERKKLTRFKPSKNDTFSYELSKAISEYTSLQKYNAQLLGETNIVHILDGKDSEITIKITDRDLNPIKKLSGGFIDSIQLKHFLTLENRFIIFGRYIYDIETGNKMFTNTLLSKIANQAIIHDIEKDKNNVIWLGTSRGLFTLRVINQKNFSRIIDPDKKTSHRFFLPYNKRILSATYQGLKLFDTKNNNVTDWNDSRFHKSYLTALDLNNEIYLGSAGNQITVINKNQEIINEILLPSECSSTKGNLYVFLTKHKGQIFAASNHCLYTINDEKEFKEFLPYQNIEEDLSIKNIFTFDELILASNKGLWILNPDRNEFVPYLEELIIYYVSQDLDDNNIFWLSTNKGLVKWNYKSKIEYTLNTSNSLSSNIITAIYQDPYGYLWCPSFYGLMQIDKSNKDCYTYFEKDGIPNNEFNFYSDLKLDDGSFLFGTITGAVKFNPKDFINEASKANKLQLDKVIIKYKGQFNDITNSVRSTNEIYFKPYYNEVELTIINPVATFTKNKLLRYRISSSSSNEKGNWIIQKNHSINISQRAYGSYTLEIESRTNNSPWSDTQVLNISFAAPFYLRTKNLISFGIFLLLLWRYSQYRKGLKVTRDKKILEEKIEERTKALASSNASKNKMFTIIAHDLRNPIASLKNITAKVNFLVEKNQPQRIQELTEHLDKKLDSLTANLNNILNWALAEQETLPYQAEEIRLKPLANRIIDIYYAIIIEKNITVENLVHDNDTVFCDETGLETILRNVIHNALKFSPNNSKVVISANIKGEFIEIGISDSGPGIDAHTNDQSVNKGLGLGLTIINELVTLNKGEVSFNNAKPHGTIVKIVLPRNTINQ